jgi:hypothetical protein
MSTDDATERPTADPDEPPIPPSNPRQRTIAVGAFGAGVLGVVVAIFILRDPLTPLTRENLDAAREKWQSANVSTYHHRYEMSGGVYDVHVDNGDVRRLLLNGQPTTSNKPNLYSVDGLFDILDEELRNAAKTKERGAVGTPGVDRSKSAGGAILLYVRFHPELGYVERFLRVVGGSNRSHGVETFTFEQEVQSQ